MLDARAASIIDFSASRGGTADDILLLEAILAWGARADDAVLHTAMAPFFAILFFCLCRSELCILWRPVRNEPECICGWFGSVGS
jgi:hypothetical protein